MMKHQEDRFRPIRFHEAVALFICLVVGSVAMSLDSKIQRAPVASSETRFVERSVSGMNIVPASCPSNPHNSAECSVIVPPTTGGDPTGNPGVPYNPPQAQQDPSCPVGLHMGPGLCLCDDTNTPPDASGNCTIQQCPPGTQMVNGQCVSVNQCQLPTSCADDTHVLDQCTGQTVDCAGTYGAGWYCQAGACRRPAAPAAALSAVPSLLPPNRTTLITWSSTNTTSCTVRGSNGDGSVANIEWNTKNGSQTSSPITAQTTFTLRCVGYDNSTITKKVTVNIIPNWHEE